MLAGAVVSANVVVLTAIAAADSRTAPTRWTVAESDVVATSPPVLVVPGTAPIGPAEPVADHGPAPLRASEDWVDQVSTATGIGRVAVGAYGAATLTLARDRPGCRLGWPTLAGIGAVESGHGTHGGGVLLEDGRPSLPVLGPALDGQNGTAAIRAMPDDTAWTQDAVWAHAVGPMQFLPSTWRRWESDGDGDGALDPNDLDDAALAAGRYLCASGGDLTTGEGWTDAVFSYNHDDAYVSLVRTTADWYAVAARPATG